MKKRICILFAFLLVFVMVGCASNNRPTQPDPVVPTLESSTPEEETSTPDQSEEPSQPTQDPTNLNPENFISNRTLDLLSYTTALGYTTCSPRDYYFEHDGKIFYLECNSETIGLWIPQEEPGVYLVYSVLKDTLNYSLADIEDYVDAGDDELWGCTPNLAEAFKIGPAWLYNAAQTGDYADPFIHLDHWIGEYAGVKFAEDGKIDAMWVDIIRTEHIPSETN